MQAQTTTFLSRILKYAVVRAIWLIAMIVIGMFIVVFVVNYGGFIDQMMQANIDEAVAFAGFGGGFKGMTPEEIVKVSEEMRWNMAEAAGLHQPFLLRCLRWTYNAVRFDLGKSNWQTTISLRTESMADVSAIIRERLPITLMLSGTTNILVFIASIFISLALARKHGSWVDRLMVALSPLSATPNWIYGVLLIVIFAGSLGWLPYGGMFDTFPPETRLGYVWIVGKHMILPGLAIALSAFFQCVYAWRTFYLMHIEDDHVELARAKGLPNTIIERRYIIRPTLPYLITSFALMLISFWQGVIALEIVFDWPGIAGVLLGSLRGNDRNMVVGVLVTFAYLLAITVFLLDIFYAWVDPKVRISGESQTVQPIKPRMPLSERLRRWKRPVVMLPKLPDLRRVATVPGLKTRGGLGDWIKQIPKQLSAGWRQIRNYPSVVAGSIIIFILVGVAIYTLIAIPQSQAKLLWDGTTDRWDYNPKNGLPAWVNYFRSDKLPESIVLDTREGDVQKTAKVITPEMSELDLDFSFNYSYNGFPQELVLNLDSHYAEKHPHLVMKWLTPDGRELEIFNGSMTSTLIYYPAQDARLQKKLGYKVIPVLFTRAEDPSSSSGNTLQSSPTAQRGTYTLRVIAYTFEPETTVDGKLIVYGQVAGLAGTDDKRRDLTLALLWGTPVALAFGLGGAVITSLATMFLAALGVWFSGWVDQLIQRITEINLLLPALPIGIMVYYLYSNTVWAILGVMVILNIFGSSLKNFRAVFIQVRESPYIEAAQAYGVSSWRIIMHYMVPRILPVLIPQMVILVPGYIFLEATLAFMGVSDPHLPTWGKVIYESITHGAFEGYFYWILEPICLLLITGLAFALVGFALERIYNPRLRIQ